MIEKKNEKAEDFIGWKSPDEKLEVVGIVGKQSTSALFKVTCTECSKDHELFPDGYFVSTKWNLIKGCQPCGCSNKPKWKPWQFLILTRRAAKDRFIVHGFAGEFRGKNTKLNLECLKDGHKWTARITDIINKGYGCPKCAGHLKPTEQEALEECQKICDEMDYDLVGFPDEYKNNKSRFEYICKIHGKQSVRYYSFVNIRSRCGGCWKAKQKELGNLYGYYPERKDEIDYLYILNFDNKFIKVGRSFNVDERIKGLRDVSKILKKNIHKLRIFTATHQEIYDYEQELHSDLRNRNFQHYVDWSTECFENDSLYILNKLLDECGLEEVTL